MVGTMSPETRTAEKPLPEFSNKRQTVFTRLAIIGGIAVLIGCIWWLFSIGKEGTDDAYVDGHISNISSRISGTTTQVFVVDNQLVHAGDVLAQIDPNDYQTKVEQAQAALDESIHQANAAKNKIDQSLLSSKGQTTQARADVSSMHAQIDSASFASAQAKASIREAQMKVSEQESQLKFANSDYERYKSAYADGVVTKQQYDKAKEACDMAEAQMQQAKDNLQFSKDRLFQSSAQFEDSVGRFKKSQGGVTSALAAVDQLKIDQETYASSLAAVKKAQADLKQAMLNLSYTKIIAPVDGRIGHKMIEVGQQVEAGQAIMALVHDVPWITANYKETQVGKMRPGQKVEIKIDSFPNRALKGYIDSISPASGAKFSILPPDNATGNFTKVVQRVPVKIIFDEVSIHSIKGLLTPGMSCTVTVFTKS